MFSLKRCVDAHFQTYIDFFSEKSQARRGSSAKLESFIFKHKTDISTTCVVPDWHSLP